jgi:hypothetical protein
MVAASLHGTLGQVVIAVVASLFVYWATERYAELLAAGARGQVLDRRSVVAALRQGWPMLESSYSPVVVLLVASVLGVELRPAVLAALCLSTVLLAGLGYGAARRSRVGGHERPAWRGRHRLEAGTALTMTPSGSCRTVSSRSRREWRRRAPEAEMSGSAPTGRAEAPAGGVLLTLASGQFLMTLDSSVSR